jgi:carbamoyl-phosphate synthase large subunit
VRAKAEAIAQALGSVGPLNIQGRLDSGEFVPFEINPRFSGTTPMRAMAGFNEPELLIDWHLDPDQPWSYHPTMTHGEFTRGLIEYFTPLTDKG